MIIEHWWYWPVLLFLMVALLATMNKNRLASRHDFVRQYAFHPGLHTKMQTLYPSLQSHDTDLVFEGLRQYFSICVEAQGQLVAMPSRAVDDLWHQFILFTRDYQQFCEHAFGRYLHHNPAETLAHTIRPDEGIRRAWRIACRLERINPLKPEKLPLLFAVDGLLNIVNGFIYRLDCKGRWLQGNTYCGAALGCGGSGAGCASAGDGSGCSGGCGGGGD